MVAGGADGVAGERGKGGEFVRVVVCIQDEAGDFVGLVGDEGFVEKGGEREIGEGHLGRDALDGGAGGYAGEFVTGARGCGFGEEVFEVAEGVGNAVDGVVERHGFARWTAGWDVAGGSLSMRRKVVVNPKKRTSAAKAVPLSTVRNRTRHPLFARDRSGLIMRWVGRPGVRRSSRRRSRR